MTVFRNASLSRRATSACWRSVMSSVVPKKQLSSPMTTFSPDHNMRRIWPELGANVDFEIAHRFMPVDF